MYETLSFPSAAAFREWLAQNHCESDGIWLKISKKDCEEPSVSYAEALDEALCFGWIDGQKQSLNDSFWLQKFTPRRKNSAWSKINTQHADRLIQSGQMEARGQAAIDAAKADGRWDAAYDSPSTSTLPQDFLDELHKNKEATAFYESLSKANQYAISYRLQTAKKPETKIKRMEMIIEMLKRGESFH